jgi:hypothetical protein
MNKAFALLFTFIYIVLAYFLAVLGSIHGSNLYPYFELSFLVIALTVFLWLCFWIPPRQPGHGLATLTLCGVGVGALLVLASFASRGPLIEGDVRQRAAATEVFNMRPPAVRRYEKRKLYNFTVDLVPDFHRP